MQKWGLLSRSQLLGTVDFDAFYTTRGDFIWAKLVASRTNLFGVRITTWFANLGWRGSASECACA